MVELNGGRISFNEPKTAASVRMIGILESLIGPLATLCEGLGSDDLVITSPRGEPIRSRNFRARVAASGTTVPSGFHPDAAAIAASIRRRDVLVVLEQVPIGLQRRPDVLVPESGLDLLRSDTPTISNATQQL